MAVRNDASGLEQLIVAGMVGHAATVAPTGKTGGDGGADLTRR